MERLSVSIRAAAVLPDGFLEFMLREALGGLYFGERLSFEHCCDAVFRLEKQMGKCPQTGKQDCPVENVRQMMKQLIEEGLPSERRCGGKLE